MKTRASLKYFVTDCSRNRVFFIPNRLKKHSLQLLIVIFVGTNYTFYKYFLRQILQNITQKKKLVNL